MKKIISLFVFVWTFSWVSAQDFEISTLRMGPYKILMEKAEIEKLSGTKLKITYGEQKNTIKHNGENISIDLYEKYLSESQPSVPAIMGMITTSKKFKTKSGIGIGNTKDDLINAYRNYPSFSVHPAWSDKSEKPLKDTGYFTLEDLDAGTQLSFKFVNNIITEISVYLTEGC
ncbi:hypothetical protein ACM46_22500 [Chryseobacterium angstadtii]|uniref:Uncharacterized protein n=1 Tax=Chryseobacterium angstadtii TaxID=558151 RepID=A0A0J7HWT4_9FLAO|nr:hypothetical protein [Chryseobacterium angstadtii]KMQ58473.1 hypothetical protein ACM46_22500 [Chryseobacterium angstadtii]